MRSLLLLLTAASWLFAQTTTHSATLTWQDSQNPAGTTYNVYRATGLCSGNPAFSKVAGGVTVLTYDDTTVQPGNYCYYVTAVVNGVESAPSVSAPAPIPSFAPTSLTISAK